MKIKLQLLFLLGFFHTLTAEAQIVSHGINTLTSLQNKKTLQQVKFGSSSSTNFGNINQKVNINNLHTNLSLTFQSHETISHDGSYLEYKTDHLTMGIGKINRMWSFSPNTSLFLSNNARPTKSAYLKIDNITLPFLRSSSFEFFNSITRNQLGPKNAMLLGSRITFAPTKKIDLEFIKISQWGGDGYSIGLPNFTAAILGNTNEGEFANINQTAGFGLSYSFSGDLSPKRLYFQILGEDQAGYLPSCYIYLAGMDSQTSFSNIQTNFGVEIIDTRVDKTENGNCGPNTAYNNGTYKYTNYDTVLGTSIDSEGKSIHFWSSFQISKQTNLKFSVQDVSINDNNWSKHRLSSSKQDGRIITALTTWQKGKLQLKTELSHQSFKLDKANIKKGLNLGVFTSIKF